MKIKLLFLALCTSFVTFAQSINDYKAVIVPIKFEFAKGENPYRMSTMTKANLIKAGFVAFYSNEQLPAGYTDRCQVLYADVSRDSGFLVTKLFVELKDCFGKVVFTSEIGKSKEKDYEKAYKESLEGAFPSIYALNYQYSGNAAVVNTQVNAPMSQSTAATVVPTTPAATNVALPTATVVDATTLYAQPTENGFQLIDKTPKVVMKLLKTSRPDSFIAFKDGVQGTLNAKDNQWYFEYYKNDQLVSEKISVKF